MGIPTIMMLVLTPVDFLSVETVFVKEMKNVMMGIPAMVMHVPVYAVILVSLLPVETVFVKEMKNVMMGMQVILIPVRQFAVLKEVQIHSVVCKPLMPMVLFHLQRLFLVLENQAVALLSS